MDLWRNTQGRRTNNTVWCYYVLSLELVTAAGSHDKARVQQVVGSGADVELVGAAVILLTRAVLKGSARPGGVVGGGAILIDFAISVSEAHGIGRRVDDDVLVVSAAGTDVQHARAGPVGSGVVKQTRTAVVVQVHLATKVSNEIQSSKSSQGSTQRVTGDDDLVAGVLTDEARHLVTDSAIDALLGLVEALVHRAARALAVVHSHSIQVGDPVGDILRATERHDDGVDVGLVADVSADRLRCVVRVHVQRRGEALGVRVRVEISGHVVTAVRHLGMVQGAVSEGIVLISAGRLAHASCSCGIERHRIHLLGLLDGAKVIVVQLQGLSHEQHSKDNQETENHSEDTGVKLVLVPSETIRDVGKQ